MLFYLVLMQTRLSHLEIVFTIFKSCFELDVPMPRCDQVQTRFCVGLGEMVKLESTVCDFTEKSLHGRFTYLAIMLSFKLVYYCVYFSYESNLISFKSYIDA